MNIQASNMQTIILVLLVILISIICAALFFTNKEVRNLKNSVSKNYHDIAALHSLLEKQSKECLQEEVPMCPLPPSMNPYQTNVLPSVPEGMEPLLDSVPGNVEENQEEDSQEENNQEEDDIEVVEISTSKKEELKESSDSDDESSDDESEDSDESEEESK